jgi:hypothetical protein
MLRVSPDKVRRWIDRGELGAVNTAETRCGKPRWVILPHHLEQFERGRQASPPAKASRRRERPPLDYFPEWNN